MDDAQRLASSLLGLSVDPDEFVGTASRLNADGTVTISGQGRSITALPQTEFQSGAWAARRANGVWYAYCQGKVVATSRNILYRRSRPSVKKNQGSLKILYTVLNEQGNWDVFVGGHQTEPIKITTIASEKSNRMGILHGYITNYGTGKKHTVGIVQKKASSYSGTSPQGISTILHSYFFGDEYYQYTPNGNFGADYIGGGATASDDRSVFKWRGLGYWETYPRIAHVGWSAFTFSSGNETGRKHDDDLGYHSAKLFPREIVYKDRKDSKDVLMTCRFIDSGSDGLYNPVDYLQVAHQTPYDIGLWSSLSTDTYNYEPGYQIDAIKNASINKDGNFPFSLSWSIDSTTSSTDVFYYNSIGVLQEGFTYPLLFNTGKTKLLLKSLENYSFSRFADVLRKSYDGYDGYYNEVPYLWSSDSLPQKLNISSDLIDNTEINNFFNLEPEQTALDTAVNLGAIGKVKFYSQYYGSINYIATVPLGDIRLSNFVGNSLYIVEQPTLPKQIGDRLAVVTSGEANRSWAVDDYNAPVDKDSTIKVRVYRISDDGKLSFVATRKIDVFNLNIPNPRQLGTYRILAASYFPT